MNLGPGRGKSGYSKAQQKLTWAQLVKMIRDANFGPEDFEPMLAEIIASPPAYPYQTPEWKREHLAKAFREAGVEV